MAFDSGSNSNPTMYWDTVYAVPYRQVNESIVSSGKSPKSFRQEEQGGQLVVSGTFGPWQLMMGGAEQNIHLRLPIANATIESAGGKPIAVDSIAAVVEVRAQYLPNPETSLLDLKLQSKSAAEAPAASVLRLDPAPSSSVAAMILPQALQNWLDAHLEDFDYTFASIDLNLTADKGGFQWLTPTKTSYAIAEPAENATEDNCLFGLLSMTEHRENANLSHSLSPGIIPDGAKGVFLISTDRFLEKVVLPGLPALFLNRPPLDAFELAQDGTGITNTRKLTFQNLQLENGDVVSPWIDTKGFTVNVVGEELVIGMAGFQYTRTGGIGVSANYTSESQVYLNSLGRIDLKPVKDTTIGSIHVPKSTLWEEIGLSVALAVAGALIGAAGAGEVEVEGEVGSVSVVDGENADIDPITVTPNPNASPSSVAASEEESAATSADEVESAMAGEDKPAKNEGFFSRNKVKIKAILGGMAIGSLVSAVLDVIPLVLKELAKNGRNSGPALSVFSDAAIAPIQWADQKDFALTSASLADCFVLGGIPGGKGNSAGENGEN